MKPPRRRTLLLASRSVLCFTIGPATYATELARTAPSLLQKAPEIPMCRNIRTLFNFEPPASDEEIRASALQFVRKLSGFAHPSKANQGAFDRAVDEVTEVATRLLNSLQTSAPTRDREEEAAKAKERSRQRFATDHTH